MASDFLIFFIRLRNIFVILGSLLERIIVVQGNESISPDLELSESRKMKVESRKFGYGEVECQSSIGFCKG